MQTPDPPADVLAHTTSTPAPRGRRRDLLIAAAVLLVVLGGVLALRSLTGSTGGRVVTAVAGEGGDVVFPDPDVREDGDATVTTGEVELRGRDGRVEWRGDATMRTGAGRPSLDIDVDGDWDAPWGTEGLTIVDPKVTTRWDAGAGGFVADVHGPPTGPLVEQLQPLPIDGIAGLNGVTTPVTRPNRPAQSVSVHLGQGGEPQVVTPPIDLGPLDFGPLHVGKLTVATETDAAGRTITVLRFSQVSGALGPVEIRDAAGTVRLSTQQLQATLDLAGTLAIGDQAGPFSLAIPAALRGGTVVLGPDATVTVPVADGAVTATGTVAIALAPEAGRPLAIAAGSLTYGDITAVGTVTVANGAAGLTVDARLTEPVRIGGGLTVERGRLTYDGTAVQVDGAARFTGDGAPGSEAIEGTVAVDATYDLAAKRLTGTATAEGIRYRGVELTRATVTVDATLGGDVTLGLDAALAIGDTTTVRVTGDLTLADGVTTLRAAGTATLAGSEIAVDGTVQIADGRTTFDVTAGAADVTVPLGGTDLTLGGSIHLAGELGGPIAVDADLTVYGTSFAVTGTLTVDGGDLHLVLDATGDVTAHAEVSLTGGKVDATVTVESITFGDVTIRDATLRIVGGGGELHATVEGDVVWGDHLFAVTGSVDRGADGGFTASLAGEGELPVTDGVTVTGVRLAYDGETITLDGRAHVLTAGADATVSVTGTVTLGEQPTFDLATDAEGTVALDGDERVAFTGGLRIRSGDGATVRIDGTLSVLDQTLAFTGTLGLEDGAVALHLANTEESTVEFSLDLTVDLGAGTVHGRLAIADLRLGADPELHIREAVVEITVADGAATLTVTGSAELDNSLVVEVDATVHHELGGDLTLRFTGRARLLDRFVDVGVTGAVRVSGGTVTFDVVAEADAGLDFNGSGDLFIDGGFRLRGTLGRPIAITGEIVALDNRLAFTGTFEGTLADATLHLTDAPGSTTGFLLDATLVDSTVTAHLRLDRAKLDVLEVTDLDLEGTIAEDDTTVLTVAAGVELADPSGKVAGITSAHAELAGIFRRSAEGADSLHLAATIDRLVTTGDTDRTFGGLRLDYLDLELDLTRAAEGEPITVTISKAQLAAVRQADGSYALPGTPEAEGNDRIDLDGWVTLTDDGKIHAWHLEGEIDRLTYDQLVVSGTFTAGGEGLGKVVTGHLDVTGGTRDGNITGELSGDVGYTEGSGFVFDLTGTLEVKDVGGLRAGLNVRLGEGGHLAFDGVFGYGELVGEVDGELELVTLGNGTTIPRMQMRAGSVFVFYEPANPFRKDVKSDKYLRNWTSKEVTAFGEVTISNWDDPTTLRFHAGAVGRATIHALGGYAGAAAGAGITAEGTLVDIGGRPSFDLSIRARVGAEAQVLGFLRLTADGGAVVEARGNFQRIEINARAMAIVGLGVGVPLPVAQGRMDVSFVADLTGDQVYTVNARAHAGASILGPIATADGGLELTGTVDLKNKRATLEAKGGFRAQVLLVIARAKGSGSVSLDVDFASEKPFVTGTARVDFSAHVLWKKTDGMNLDLRYDGRTLWVTGGTKVIKTGFLKRARRVVNARGTLYPVERICGDQQVKKWGKWKNDGQWGDCGQRGLGTGRILEDVDTSGGASPGDPGIGGLTVRIVGADGALLGETTTEANGAWIADDLNVGGPYQAQLVLPEDRRIVADPDGTPDGIVNFWIRNGEWTSTDPIVLSAPAEPATGTVTGRLVEDIMADGSLDGDPPLADVQVRIDGPRALTVRTDETGTFRVEGLEPGEYRVSPAQPISTVTVDPDDELDGATTVTVVGDEVVDAGTFGLHDDGQPDVPEVPLPEGFVPTVPEEQTAEPTAPVERDDPEGPVTPAPPTTLAPVPERSGPVTPEGPTRPTRPEEIPVERTREEEPVPAGS